MNCFTCQKPATYKIKAFKEKVAFCDYCYYRKKFNHSDKEMTILSHLSTKQGVEDRHKAIGEYLLPQINKLLTKKMFQASKKGTDHLMESISPKLREFLVEKNVGFYELITCLGLKYGKL